MIFFANRLLIKNLVIIAALVSAIDADVPPPPDEIFLESIKFWNRLRDQSNGLYCDFTKTDDQTECGDGSYWGTDYYSSAVTGLGLIIDTIQVELGLLTNEDGRQRALQTIETLKVNFPRSAKHGFFTQWSNSNFEASVDTFSGQYTSMVAAGALFSGNYFGGEVSGEAEGLFQSINWSGAITDVNVPSIMSQVKANGDFATETTLGDMVIFAAMARRQDPSWFINKGSEFYERFVGVDSVPTGMDTHDYPVFVDYNGHQTLGAAADTFQPTSYIQFPYFVLKHFQSNNFYNDISQSWLEGNFYNFIVLNANRDIRA